MLRSIGEQSVSCSLACTQSVSYIASLSRAAVDQVVPMLLHRTSYSAPDRAAEYCDECVCLCVCLCFCVRDHIFGITRPIFPKFFVLVTYGRVSVLLWRRSDMLCTSGFMDDIIFAQAEAARRRRQAEALRLARSLGLGA